LTGYGLILGTVEGFKSDVLWSVIRGNPFGRSRIVGPPPSDALGKAYRYLAQPAWHYFHAQGFSYEDHWLLTAADVVATGLIREAGGLDVLPERWATVTDTPLLDIEPWNPATRQTLTELSIDVSLSTGPPIGGLPDLATYGDVLTTIIARFPDWIKEASEDFPLSASANLFQLVMSDGGEAVLDDLNDGDAQISPVFEPEEIVWGRMWEFGVFPPDEDGIDSLEWFIARSLAIAAGGGHELPSRSEMILAAQEVWGGFAAR
jgi:hypothetical protein